MKAEEFITEAKKGRRAIRHNIKPRDPNYSTLMAKASSGAGGAHKDKKRAEKTGDVKHKKDYARSDEKLNIPFAGAKVGQKEGPAGQWRNKGSSKNRAAKKGDLVGGGQ